MGTTKGNTKKTRNQPPAKSEENKLAVEEQPNRDPTRPLKVVGTKPDGKNVELEFGFSKDRQLNRTILKRTFGIRDVDAVFRLLPQLAAVVSRGGTDTAQADCNYAMALTHGIGPKDAVEGLLAAQMVAAHTLAMKFMADASCEGQTFEGKDTNVNRAAKLLRIFTAQVEALTRYRVQGQQKVTVEHVNVHEGGQAIVGTVNQGGGGDK